MISRVWSAPETGKRVALLTPVRDEGMYIGAMLQSIATQDIQPANWIIVDDGSTDDTREIVGQYVRQHGFIKLIELPQRQERRPGGESAIAYGLRSLNLTEFDFVARFDADLIFERDYIAKILQEFSSDATLGIAGGGLYIQSDCGWRLEEAPEYHVRGALKMYRRECFEEIGGLSPQIGWDTIDEVSSWMKGWKTRSFVQYRVIHRRPTGQGLRASRIWRARGKAEYFTWSHPLFVLAKTFKIAREHRNLTAPVCFVAGFLWSYVQRHERARERGFVQMRRRQQFDRMISALRDGPAEIYSSVLKFWHARQETGNSNVGD